MYPICMGETMTALAIALFMLVVWIAVDVTHTFTFGHSGGSQTLQDSISVVGGVATDSAFTISNGATDIQKPINFTVASLQGIYIKTDQDLTLETNSASAPQETINLKAGKPCIWVKNTGIAVPFAGNVTAMFFSNPGATTAQVYIRAIET